MDVGRGTLLSLFCFVAFAIVIINSTPTMHKASQCFKSRGIPKVAFKCERNHMIKIHRAFHGIAVKDRSILDLNEDCTPSPGHVSSNCTQCKGDCIDDSMNLVYDWSTCMGNTSCIRTVMQSYMPACPGGDKFSDYLQVEYQCVPKKDVINICSNVVQTIEEGYIMSPNYPHNYPTNMDCLCRIYTDWSSRIHLSMYDLLLETKNGRCRADWLMLRQKDQKHRHCGAIMTGTKNITSETNAIEIQFHSDENDNRTQNFQYFTRSLKGFWLYLSAKPRSNLKIACRRLTPQDQEVREIQSDDAEFEEIISTKDVQMTTEASVTKNDETMTGMPPKIGPKGNHPNPNLKKGSRRPKVKNNDKVAEAGDKEANYQPGASGSASSLICTTSSTVLALMTSVLLTH